MCSKYIPFLFLFILYSLPHNNHSQSFEHHGPLIHRTLGPKNSQGPPNNNNSLYSKEFETFQTLKLHINNK